MLPTASALPVQDAIHGADPPRPWVPSAGVTVSLLVALSARSLASRQVLNMSLSNDLAILHKTLRRATVAVLTLTALAACGCASVRTYQSLKQPIGVPLSAEIGASLFHIDRSRDLPNVFGKADLWGGKVSDGYVDVVFAGVAENGALRLHLTDAGTMSDENTMSRYGTTQVRATTTTAGNVSVTDVSIAQAPHGSTTLLPPNTIELLYEPRTGPLVLRGIEITVLQASATRCQFRLRDVRTPPIGP